jgi:thiamine pyrophosphokinase
MSQGKFHSQNRLEEFHRRVNLSGEVLVIGPMAHSFPHHLLSQNMAVLGVDGGSSKAAHDYYHYMIGDGDSALEPQTLDELFPSEKDDSDLALALAILPPGPLKLHMWGFWGGRFDHHMTNLGETLAWINAQGGRVLFYLEGEYEVIGLPAGSHSFKIEGLFSLFSPLENQFSIEGECKYPLASSLIAPLSSRLLSNEGHGMVKITSNGPFFCYMRKQ